MRWSVGIAKAVELVRWLEGNPDDAAGRVIGRDLATGEGDFEFN